ncbi:MAG: hypothetical protein JJE04_12485, partial [Acidobacteriia bacterium]|nr:hypothetical protein [Terriglobia bacterium]
MPLFISTLLFLLIAVAGAAVGMRLWVRPKEAIERVTGTGPVDSEEMPIHPSLMFHELVKKLGTMLPVSPKDASVIQRRMIRAGIRNPNAMKFFYGAKVIFGVLMPVLMGLAVARSTADPTNKVMAILASGAIGFFLPNEYVNLKGKKRQKQIRRGLPNALDLLVVCVESGLG